MSPFSTTILSKFTLSAKSPPGFFTSVSCASVSDEVSNLYGPFADGAATTRSVSSLRIAFTLSSAVVFPFLNSVQALSAIAPYVAAGRMPVRRMLRSRSAEVFFSLKWIV